MSEYSHLMFDPFAPDTVQKLEQIPEFRFTMKDKNKAIAFLILAWDVNNRSWQKQFTRYLDMKREAALLAGFELDRSNKFPRHVEDMIIGANEEFNRAVIRYLYLTGIPELPALSAHRELQSVEMEAAFNPGTTPKERKEIRVNIDAGTERISEYEEKIFGGRESESMRTELYRYMESMKLRLRPEDIAKAISTRSVGEIIRL